jgi:DNA repair protein SbcD/Mre11
MNIRFMHIADVHLGYAQYGSSERYNDFYRSFAAAIDDALQEHVDLVIIAGDLFHQRSLSPQTLLQAAHELERLRDAAIPIVAVIGNHEQAHYRDQFSWLDYLAGRRLLILLHAKYENSELCLAPHNGQSGSYVDIAGMRIYGMRYAGAVTPRLVADAAQALSRQSAADKPAFTVFVTHAGLDGIVPNFAANITREQLACLRPLVDYLALGHIHKPFQEEGWIFNPGSLEPNSFPEAEYEGGALLVDVNTTREPRIVITPRRYAIRPFVRLPLAVSAFESPDALYAGVEAYLSGQGRTYKKRPVVELSLEGVLHFDRQSLNLDRIEASLQKALNPIVARVRNRTATAEYEVRGSAGQLSRSEL